jgi:beta-1,4-mannosyltransferase
VDISSAVSDREGRTKVILKFVVASWPGVWSRNLYIERFCESLEWVDVAVVAVNHPVDVIFKRIDILHIHWPNSVFWGVGSVVGGFRALLALFSLLLLKLRRVKIVWCVHNLEPHNDGGRIFALFWRSYQNMIVNLIDGFVTLSPSTVELARNKLRGLAHKPGTFIWHPDYRVRSELPHRCVWRNTNGIPVSAKAIALIGQIRPYKGVEELIDCFSQTNDSSLRLIIAGGPENQSYSDKISALARKDDRIILKLSSLSEEELSSLVLASDVIVLPYRKIFHSGSIIYALSCGKPVITAASAYAMDLRDQVGWRWLHLYEGGLSKNHLEGVLSSEDERPNLEFLSITHSGPKLKQFYMSL